MPAQSNFQPIRVLLCVRRFIVATLLSVTPLLAQKRISAPRSDGHMTPLLVYAASGSAGCAPLAEAMSHNGFTTVVMGHRESGLAALRSDIRASGLRSGVQDLVADPNAEQARLLDVGAALQWAATQCQAPFRVLLGHSMGAETVMLEAGARNTIGVESPPAGQNRFDAYVALSPEGPGIVFPDHAWSGIHKPMLILTGTRDQSLKGGPQARQFPFRDLPGGACQWMGVIDGATHMNFAGNGPGADRVEPMIVRTIAAYLNGVRSGACVLPTGDPAMTLRSK